MPLIVAGTAARANTMLAAPITTRANSVMSLRPGRREALEVANFIFRFMFRNPPMSDEKLVAPPAAQNLCDGDDDSMTIVETRDDDRGLRSLPTVLSAGV